MESKKVAIRVIKKYNLQIGSNFVTTYRESSADNVAAIQFLINFLVGNEVIIII